MPMWDYKNLTAVVDYARSGGNSSMIKTLDKEMSKII